MASVIDNNVVMWDIGDGGVKTVCNAVLGGKGRYFTWLFITFICYNFMNYYLNLYFSIFVKFCLILNP